MHQGHPTYQRTNTPAAFSLLATYHSIIWMYRIIFKIHRQKQEIIDILLRRVQWNTGLLEAYFSQCSGINFFFFFLPHHTLNTVVWAVQRGACHSEFFHPDKNRWGRPAARYTCSRQNRKGASTLQGPHVRQTLQFHLHLSSAHTKNKRIWNGDDPSLMTGCSAFPTLH